MKICIICQGEISNAGRRKTCSDVCYVQHDKNRKKLYKQQNTQRCKDYAKEYYRSNKTKCRKSEQESRAKYRKTLETNRERRVHVIVKSCCNSAKHRGLDFNITSDIIHTMIIIQSNKCVLTGIEFDWSFSDNYRSNPFSPSIDRKDSKRGYTYDNIQIVCYIVNLAKNEYPTELFDVICRARMAVINGKI